MNGGMISTGIEPRPGRFPILIARLEELNHSLVELCKMAETVSAQIAGLPKEVGQGNDTRPEQPSDSVLGRLQELVSTAEIRVVTARNAVRRVSEELG